ncbi:ABC transporter substrate-binding protein [Ancylobacter amanitiformis]|uniref:Peptide/nickel transport system substrate-binding protein n=1 Tax=Ancylobacter amanitiformis TaxID=217069 RepID=A0ABU0LW36_9HYPH|nr:ABC transporter substrate-binding protein [Ancylobacter amanitiformis]MDQ0512882.1 peptide/nickel transport system substrate-binding protein [Ancylobacter amanitiformis]
MSLLRALLIAGAMALPASLPTGLSVALAATPPSVLVVAQNIDDIVAIDPAQSFEYSSGEYVAQVYDRLIQYDAEDTSKLVGALASDWTIDEAAKTITFTLRKGVTFHSGNPLRPEDVLYSFKRVVALNKVPSFILTQLGWTPETIDAMVTADGPDKVVVRYTGDFSSGFALNALAARPGSIIDAKTVQQHEVNGDFGNGWLNANSAGTGAFKLRTYRPGDILVLDANPAYFRGAPIMKQVLIRHVAEAATQQLLLKSGDVDMAKNLTPDQIAGLGASAKVVAYPQASVHFLSFNQKTAALTPPAVWEAARYLVDYEGMTSTFLKGQMQVYQSFNPKGFPGALEATPYHYDVEKAKKILAEAGIKTPIKVTLDVINSSPFTDIAQSLQASFAKAGIEFDILPGTGSQVITKYRARAHQAMLLYWGPDFMDPHSNAQAFAFNDNNADDHYQSTTTWRNAWKVPPELNAETKAALAEPDPARRNALYVDLQAKVQARSPIVVMFQAESQIAMNPKVTGYVNGALSDFVFYRLVDKK